MLASALQWRAGSCEHKVWSQCIETIHGSCDSLTGLESCAASLWGSQWNNIQLNVTGRNHLATVYILFSDILPPSTHYCLLAFHCYLFILCFLLSAVMLFFWTCSGLIPVKTSFLTLTTVPNLHPSISALTFPHFLTALKRQLVTWLV